MLVIELLKNLLQNKVFDFLTQVNKSIIHEVFIRSTYSHPISTHELQLSLDSFICGSVSCQTGTFTVKL